MIWADMVGFLDLSFAKNEYDYKLFHKFTALTHALKIYLRNFRYNSESQPLLKLARARTLRFKNLRE